jgi:hypothetical protein
VVVDLSVPQSVKFSRFDGWARSTPMTRRLVRGVVLDLWAPAACGAGNAWGPIVVYLANKEV